MTLKIQVSSAFPAAVLASETQFVTLPGTTPILATTTLLIFEKPAISDSPCTFPSVLLRSDGELEVYDFTGKAGKMSFTPFGTETIMNSTNPWEADSGGVAQSGAALIFRSIRALLGWTVK